MKGKIAFVLGATVGYVLGTRAGRERYEQIKRGAQAVWTSPPVQSGVDSVKGAVGHQVEAAQQAAMRAGKNLLAAMSRQADEASWQTTDEARQAQAQQAADGVRRAQRPAETTVDPAAAVEASAQTETTQS